MDFQKLNPDQQNAISNLLNAVAAGKGSIINAIPVVGTNVPAAQLTKILDAIHECERMGLINRWP